MAQCDSKKILNLPKEDFLKTIKEFMENKEVYTSKQFRKSNFLNLYSIFKKLDIDSWMDLITMLNLESKYRNPRKLSKETLVKSYEMVQKKLNKSIISSLEFEENSRHSIKTIYEIFGSWKNFTIACNSHMVRETNTVTETNEELIEMYKKYSEKLGKIRGASIEDLKKSKEIYSYSVFVKRFGSWIEFKKLCGYEVSGRNLYTKEEIISLLSGKLKIKGRRLSQNEINKDGDLPALETILKAFKTTKISVVWDEIEGKNKTVIGKVYSKEEIFKLLSEEYKKTGKILSVSEIKKNPNLPGISTIYRKFNTTKILEVWNVILKERVINEL
ncbi:MAG: homing endonuclease associated repeat-containing protein [Cetobacterium sp.]|uniref:homing endonuclease associated repeat-containing protein n=1 Tax=Cetobacterium sp. TaxID=2071632 RepID=UPI003F2E06AD